MKDNAKKISQIHKNDMFILLGVLLIFVIVSIVYGVLASQNTKVTEKLNVIDTSVVLSRVDTVIKIEDETNDDISVIFQISTGVTPVNVIEANYEYAFTNVQIDDVEYLSNWSVTPISLTKDKISYMNKNSFMISIYNTSFPAGNNMNVFRLHLKKLTPVYSMSIKPLSFSIYPHDGKGVKLDVDLSNLDINNN